MWIVSKKHNSGSTGELKRCKSYKKALEELFKFAEEYGFEKTDNLDYPLHDPGHLRSDGQNEDKNIKVLEYVRDTKGRLMGFTHCQGDGPVVRIKFLLN